MRALLTRDGDYFLPLGARVEKARAVKADLLVSIHADAFKRPERARLVGVRALRPARHLRDGAHPGEAGERVRT